MRALITNVVLLLLLLTVQNLVAVSSSSSPVLPVVELDTTMSSYSPNKEILRKRFIHLKNEWFQRHTYILSVFLSEGIKSWYDYVAFIENLDEINSVKNRNDSYQDDDDENYGGDASAFS